MHATRVPLPWQVYNVTVAEDAFLDLDGYMLEPIDEQFEARYGLPFGVWCIVCLYCGPDLGPY